MENVTNEDIFDYVISCEDEQLKNVREEVIKHAEYNYGERGRKIAEKYYKNIDGEDDFSFDDEQDTDLCPECVEKAKRLVETMDFSKFIVEILTDDKITQLFNDVEEESGVPLDLDIVEEELSLNTCIKIDPISMKKLVFRICIEHARKLWKELTDNVSEIDQ